MRFIVKNKCRQYLLYQSRVRRNGQFTRVSPAVFARLESKIVEEMDQILFGNPSRGKTIR